MMPPIWIMEESKDCGKTWRVSSPWEVYKRKESAEKRLEFYKGWRWPHRITEYRAVEE